MKSKKILSAIIFIIIFIVTCSLAFANNFNGATQSVSNNGAEAVFPAKVIGPNPMNYPTYACAWVMTGDSASNYHYAQVGFSRKCTQSTDMLFWEWSKDANTWDYWDFAPATIGQNYDFKVGCDSSSMYFIVDNVTYKTVPLSNLPWPRNVVNWQGETSDSSVDCPGKTTDKLHFQSIKYKNTSNSWVAAQFSPYSSGSYMGHTYYLYTDFYIWDTRNNF